MTAAAGLAVVHPLYSILKYIFDSLWIYFTNKGRGIHLRSEPARMTAVCRGGGGSPHMSVFDPCVGGVTVAAQYLLFNIHSTIVRFSPGRPRHACHKLNETSRARWCWYGIGAEKCICLFCNYFAV